MKFLLSIMRLMIGTGVMVMAVLGMGLSGCAKGPEDRMEQAQVLLEEKYGESFLVTDYGNQVIGSGYYTVKAYAREYPELLFTVHVDDDGKHFTDNYVERRVGQKISGQVLLNLSMLHGYSYVYTQVPQAVLDITDADITPQNYIAQNQASLITVHLSYCPDGDTPESLYEMLTGAMRGMEYVNGMLAVNITDEKTLREIQNYCEGTDSLDADYNALKDRCTVLMIPIEDGKIEWTRERFSETVQGIL